MDNYPQMDHSMVVIKDLWCATIKNIFNVLHHSTKKRHWWLGHFIWIHGLID
jgi:hypothetical protein